MAIIVFNQNELGPSVVVVKRRLLFRTGHCTARQLTFFRLQLAFTANYKERIFDVDDVVVVAGVVDRARLRPDVCSRVKSSNHARKRTISIAAENVKGRVNMNDGSVEKVGFLK